MACFYETKIIPLSRKKLLYRRKKKFIEMMSFLKYKMRSSPEKNRATSAKGAHSNQL
jgi:hypothetical protein